MVEGIRIAWIQVSDLAFLIEIESVLIEYFSADLREYTASMNNMVNRMDGIIATANQDRQETNNRLAAIQRQVAAIARHLGVI